MKFSYGDFEFCDTDTGPVKFIILNNELLNPFPVNATSSYHAYDNKSFTKERAIAWLISHWYEHALMVCDCQNPDDDKGNFRSGFVETLIFMEGWS